MDLFSTVSDNLIHTLRLINTLSSFTTDIDLKKSKNEKLLDILTLLFDSVLVNLCLVRNLLIEKNQLLLNIVILHLLESRFDQVSKTVLYCIIFSS